MIKTALVVLLSCLAFQVLASSGNPYLGATMYVNPGYASNVQATMDANPNYANIMQPYKDVSTAIWLDNIGKIATINGLLTDATNMQTQTGQQVVVTFVIYDLPDRDCAALASNGEIACADSTCADGITKYKTQYIDPIVALFKQFPRVTIVAIIEPDSLPNLSTNMGVPKCTQAATAYKTCVAYAIQQLATVSNVQQYVDAAHGGWLGWANNMNDAVATFKSVLQAAGGVDLIRGFATNTANYQALGSPTSTADPCNLESQYNFAIDEVHYIQLLNSSLIAAGITGKFFITDTSRNGVTNERQSCSNWCNIKGSAMGVKPTTTTVSPLIDAYYWVKVPGESDGTSDSSAQRYDAHCGSVDSTIPAPEAGQWFASFFLTLCNGGTPVANAATVGTISTATSGTYSTGTGSQAGTTGSQAGTTGTHTTSCEVGAESCPCTSGGACDKGLSCLSNVCVELPGAIRSSSSSTVAALTFGSLAVFIVAALL